MNKNRKHYKRKELKFNSTKKSRKTRELPKRSNLKEKSMIAIAGLSATVAVSGVSYLVIGS